MTRATIIAVILLALGFLLLAWFFTRLIRRLKFKPDPISESRKKIPAGVSYIAIIIAIFMLILSWILFKTTNQLKSFKPFMPSTSIAQTNVAYEGDPVKTLKMELVLTGAETGTVPTTFYLTGNSWYLRGQHVKLPQFLTYIYKWQSFYRITDFYGDFIGHKPPGVTSTLLAHQAIGSGSENLIEFMNYVPFVKSGFKICEFQSTPVKTTDRIASYDIVLGDSCSVTLNRIR